MVGPTLWGVFLVTVVVAFAGLELSGMYLHAPWGTMTSFVRAAMAAYTWLHFVVAGLVAFGYLHLFGDWP